MSLRLENLVRKLTKREVFPTPLRRLIRKHRQYVFRRAIRQFSDLPHDATVPTTILSDLIYGWGNIGGSAKHEYIRALLQYARIANGPILECGAGLSTILLGLLAERNDNRVWSLEHNSFWAEKVRSTLKTYDVKSVEMCVADLRDYGPYSWYDLPKDKMPEYFSLVVCDGPPASSCGGPRGGRYGMLPVMKPYLQPGCVVLLDDAGRVEERNIVARWAEELGVDYRISGSEKPFALISMPSGGSS
jgi:predicted O-methyltransferase YrrM